MSIAAKCDCGKNIYYCGNNCPKNTELSIRKLVHNSTYSDDTIKLCRMILQHLGNKLNQNGKDEPSFNDIALLASDILENNKRMQGVS
jgi:hypothetical protein